MALWKKLKNRQVWIRILKERLSEPLHLNFLSILVGLFGSYRAKISFDLVLRQHNSFAILMAADQAQSLGINKIQLLEFGVASGAGLMNMAKIASRVRKVTGVEIKVVGFNTGQGMPPRKVSAITLNITSRVTFVWMLNVCRPTCRTTPDWSLVTYETRLAGLLRNSVAIAQ